MNYTQLTRRTAVGLLAASPFIASATAFAKAQPVITVYKDPTCGCCDGWVAHLDQAGFKTVVQIADMPAVKTRLGVPGVLMSCHTAEVNGYVIEGHVPAEAIKRLITKKPKAARGLAVPGMPTGSPGMEGPNPEPYDVILFGEMEPRLYMRFIETRAID